MSPAYVTREEAARYLGVSVDTLDRLRAAGKIPTYQLSPRRIGFRIADLDAHAEAQRVGSTPTMAAPTKTAQQEKPTKPDWRARMRARR